MDIKQLGYLGLHSREPEAFATYATDILGMQRVAGEDGATHFRIDDRHHRVTVETADRDGGAYYGWELADADALRAAMDELSDHGVRAQSATQRELEVRRVEGMAHFLDPAGNRVELYHGQASGEGEFTSARDIERFITGDLGLGHVVLASPDVAAQEAFYTDVLGFKISDTMRAPFRATFLHTNPRHHSIAFVDGPFFGIEHPFLHHFMLEVPDMEQVGRTYDLVLDRDVPVTMTLGQHTNDKMFSFYAESPVGVHTEFGCGGVLIDDATWQVTEIPGPDIWGHRH
ncbi:VOC family protein [Microtetraspora niveoalba]|uniref:VOC family protein n=1 Tax=Microtetraspora niveoalba TaxID=46175 RepID=UPI00082E3A68|nr:VOC family protein [Microtetraspora niveoalba]